MIELPAILTAAELTALGATIALLTALVQHLSFIPIPDGSKARAWIVATSAGLFVGLSVPGTEYAGAELAMAVVVSWSTLAAASLGLNRAGTTATTATSQAFSTRMRAPGDPGA